VALQGGLGEATVLALCARHPPTAATLTAWSSGTGFAGVFGYFWVAALHVYAGLPLRGTLLLANGLAVAWLAAFFGGLQRLGGGGGGGGGGDSGGARRDLEDAGGGEVGGGELEETAPLFPRHRSASSAAAPGALPTSTPSSDAAPDYYSSTAQSGRSHSPAAFSVASDGGEDKGERSGAGRGRDGGIIIDPRHMTRRQRLEATLALWPYTVPLFLVYAAEYSMQSGTWSAIGGF
jgi:hypothetical protein